MIVLGSGKKDLRLRTFQLLWTEACLCANGVPGRSAEPQCGKNDDQNHNKRLMATVAMIVMMYFFLSSLIFIESTMFPISICDDVSDGDEVDGCDAVNKRTTWQCALDWSHQSRLCEQELLSYPDATFHLLLLLKAALFLRLFSSSSSSSSSSSPSTSCLSSKPHFHEVLSPLRVRRW